VALTAPVAALVRALMLRPCPCVVGVKNISDVSVSVCVWAHGELLSIFCTSPFDHCVHAFKFFCAAAPAASEQASDSDTATLLNISCLP
jgi:hypothetical protein